MYKGVTIENFIETLVICMYMYFRDADGCLNKNEATAVRKIVAGNWSISYVQMLF